MRQSVTGVFRSDGPVRADRHLSCSVLGRGGCAAGIDPGFGDGSPVWTTDATGQIKHDYAAPGGAHPWMVAPVLTDADGVVRARQRFEIPRDEYRPWDVSAARF